MGDDVNSTQVLPEPIQTAIVENDSLAKPKGNIIGRLRHNPFFLAGLVFVLVVGGFFGIRYWLDVQSKIYIENSEISAPIISMSPVTPGIIDSVFVKEGDAVTEGQQLAQVGNQFILAKTSGIIIWVQNTPGQMASGATVILKMIDPNSLRVIGHIEEDKGLSQVQVGRPCMPSRATLLLSCLVSSFIASICIIRSPSLTSNFSRSVLLSARCLITLFPLWA